jgi:GNAT superfamily N-acetyltransferase
MIAPLQKPLEQLDRLVEHWNRCSRPPFVMEPRLMREYLSYPGAQLWRVGHPWKGVLWARQGPPGITLDALMVLPEWRRQGVGRELLEGLAQAVEPGVSWRFGGGSRHFVPGLPEQLGEAHGFFTALGLVPDWHAHDLLWQADSSQQSLTSWDESLYRLVGPAESEALQELMRQFGKRWQDDTALRCQALRAGAPEEIMGAFQKGRLVGFCHVWSARSQTLGSSTFWLDRSDSAWGGVGPVGVHPDQRAQGLGVGVVEAALAYLRERGARRIGVDWTGLPEFYERCGFQRWLSYRGYHPAELRGGVG